ncbi:uncharacterized protein N7511_009877 [Penicillium nucicola]|uniref:uncharacterized protein n=1 Tax=Penicillium nucicola TaxID=1850975 RepID=UPI0025458A95|nr:uncharacterized protein N7511_009877 [Penicillium nucicola]KAJ5748181.1 hypothetical protein N7511_009877 [Penicillium nucicola]
MTSENYAVFRECLSNAIVARSEGKSTKRKGKGKRNARKDVTEDLSTERANPEELAEFVDVSSNLLYSGSPSTESHPNQNQFLASETFTSFPEPLQTLSYTATQHDHTLSTLYVPADADTPLERGTLEKICTPIPLSVTDSLAVYGIIPDAVDLPDFLSPILSEYTTSVTAGPPVWSDTRTDACEICERDWIPLSYHHLIPRGVHAKVVKKGWHEEWMLNSVAWLCRACHSFVHRMASNEELAREWFTVERILERKDVQDWAGWVSKVRWKSR